MNLVPWIFFSFLSTNRLKKTLRNSNTSLVGHTKHITRNVLSVAKYYLFLINKKAYSLYLCIVSHLKTQTTPHLKHNVFVFHFFFPKSLSRKTMEPATCIKDHLRNRRPSYIKRKIHQIKMLLPCRITCYKQTFYFCIASTNRNEDYV